MSESLASMSPHGLALRAFAEGDTDALLLTRRDDGFEMPIPVRHFFRGPEDFSSLERRAIHACRGRVLDVGAGTGLHTLALQARGLAVTALDVTPEAVAIMRRRGVNDAKQGDISEFAGDTFDTLLLLGHGIGMVGDLAGLNRFLRRARTLLRPTGQLLLDSLDVRRTDDERHLVYHERNRDAGRYIGVIGMQLVFGNTVGARCEWLHVDPDALRETAGPAGWTIEILEQTDHGEYLACLTLRERS